MVVAYFDCFSGICGDMILGALLDLGLDSNILQKELKKLDISGYNIHVKKVESHSLAGSDIEIIVKEKQHQRNLHDISKILDESTLDQDIKTRSKQIFLKLARAESKVHNTTVETIHFHEIGAVDSIIDIVGSVIGIKKLDISTIFCSPLPLGKGFIECNHGILPVPAPATVELLKNVPIYQTDRKQELVTPTGAAIITTLTQSFGDMPNMKITKIGYGAGKTKSQYPNLLRVFIGELEKKEKGL